MRRGGMVSILCIGVSGFLLGFVFVFVKLYQIRYQHSVFILYAERCWQYMNL